MHCSEAAAQPIHSITSITSSARNRIDCGIPAELLTSYPVTPKFTEPAAIAQLEPSSIAA
jgi:hypothetical protein